MVIINVLVGLKNLDTFWTHEELYYSRFFLGNRSFINYEMENGDWAFFGKKQLNINDVKNRLKIWLIDQHIKINFGLLAIERNTVNYFFNWVL